MKLELEYPAGWTRQPIDGGELVIVPGFAFVPDLTLEVHPLRRRLDVHADQVISARLPQGAKLAYGRAFAMTSNTGWPMNIVEARVLAADDSFLEARLLCAYECLSFRGVVLARATSAPRMAANEDAIVATFRTARPRFRDGQPAEISELWDMTV